MNLSAIEFLYPYLLIFFFLFILYATIWVIRTPKFLQIFLKPLPISNIYFFSYKRDPIRRWILVIISGIDKIFAFLALLLLLLALAGPIYTQKWSEIQYSGVDIIVTIDISPSMLSVDLPYDSLKKLVRRGEFFIDTTGALKNLSRLNVAKATTEEFIKNREYDRIGLVIFSGVAYTLSPLTLDKEFLINTVRSIDFDMVSEKGTAIGDALAVSILRLKESEAKSKVIILLTDGVNNRGSIDPITASKIAKNFGIRIYTIGIGSSFPLFPTDLYSGIYVINPQNKINEEALQEIAKNTGGEFFKAENPSQLKKIYSQIDKMEKTIYKVRKYKVYQPLFLNIMDIAFILLIIALFTKTIIFPTFP